MLHTASMIRFPESLYAESDWSENPYINWAYNAPPRNTNGDRASETNVNYQLALNAMTIPHTRELMFMTFMAMILEVRPFHNKYLIPFMSLASTESLDVKVPALFLGIS